MAVRAVIPNKKRRLMATLKKNIFIEFRNHEPVFSD